MKKIHILSFCFFLTLIGTIVLSIRTIDAAYQINEIAGKQYSDRVNHEFNNSIIYCFLDGEVLNINIQSEIWGDLVGSGFQGLLVEIKDDITEEIIRSWLILYGDTMEHHFTSEVVLTGVYQIKFSSLNIDSIYYSWQIENNIPSWTYDITINNIDEVYFGVERFAEYYSSIEKLVVDISTEEWTDEEYFVNFETFEDTMLLNYVGNFTIEQRIVEAMYIEEGLVPYDWYKIDFNCPIEPNLSVVNFKLYYDHEQLENTVRIFYSTGDMVLESIPNDSHHSHPNYLWKKLEPDITNPEPPIEPYYPYDIVRYSLIVIYFLVWIGTIIWAIAKIVETRRNNSNQKQVPSEKYSRYHDNSVSYSPESYYHVNFRETVQDYKLTTDAKMQITCAICLQIIRQSSDIIRCPSCDMAFHKNHLFDWVKIRGNCPACKVNLRTT